MDVTELAQVAKQALRLMDPSDAPVNACRVSHTECIQLQLQLQAQNYP